MKKFAPVAIITSVLLIASLGTAAFLAWDVASRFEVMEKELRPERQVAVVEPAPVVEPVQASTSPTQYISGDDSFRFSYPNNWTLEVLDEVRGSVSLRSPTYQPIQSGSVVFFGEVFVRKIPNHARLSIRDLYATFDDASSWWFDLFEYEEVVMNGKPAVIFEDLQIEAHYARTQITLACPDSVISIGYLYGDDDRYREVVKDIAASVICE